MSIGRYSLCIMLAISIVGCSTTIYGRRDWSDEAARREAEQDIASGQIKILCGGTIAGGPLGVDVDELALIRGIPQRWFPTGCTVPYANEGANYGTVYNREILRFLAARVDGTNHTAHGFIPDSR